MLCSVGVELAKRGSPSFLLVHFFFDARETGQRAALVQATQRGTNLSFRLGPSRPGDEQLFFRRRILDLRLELMQGGFERLDLLGLLVILRLEAVRGLLE